MSSGAFNKHLSQYIVDRARQELLKLGSQVVVDQKGKTVVSETSILSIEQIRKDTNLASSGYKSVVSREGILNLSKEFAEYLNENSLGKAASDLLSRKEIFDAFKDFIANKYSDSPTRKSNTAAYSYETIKTKRGNIRLGDSTDSASRDIIIFKNLNHGDLKPLFIDFLGTITTDKDLLEFISKNLDAGHLAGVFNLRFQRLFNLQISTSEASSYRDFKVTAGTNEDLNSTFNDILRLLNDADYISSNIVYDITLNTSLQKDLYSKKNPSAAAELQLSLANQKFGRALAVVGRRLNELIIAVDAKRGRVDSVGAKKAANDIINSLKSVAELVTNTGNKLLSLGLNPEVKRRIEAIMSDTGSILKLIDTPGSDTLKQSIGKIVSSAISGKPLPARQLTKVAKKDKLRIGNQSTKSTPPKVKNKPHPIDIRLPKIEQRDPQLDLTSLTMFINQHLQDVVAANMGDGTRSDVLNYRTGRFAASVKVEQLSQSRAGMITAFYTYMKNPYATFSTGGQQEFPQSRDPKLLISSSIRQIAAEKVANRLRAVVV